MVTLEAIQARATSITDRGQRQLLRVVILRHPNAPAQIVTDLTEMLLELDINILFDEDISPFVPNYAEALPYKPAEDGAPEGPVEESAEPETPPSAGPPMPEAPAEPKS